MTCPVNVCFSRGSQEPPCLLKPYFIAWSLSNWISLKEKTRWPHERTVLGLGRRVRTALKRNYTHEAPEFSLCETPSILLLASGKLRASWEWVKDLSKESLPVRLNNISKGKLEHFFHVRLGRYDNWVWRRWAWQEWDMRRCFSKWQNSSTGVLKLAKASYSIGKCFFSACLLSIIFFLFFLKYSSTLGGQKIFFKTQRIDCHLGVLLRGTDQLC